MASDIVRIDHETRQEIIYQFNNGMEEQYTCIHEMLTQINEIAAREKYEPLYKLLVSFVENTYVSSNELLVRHCEDWRDSDGSIVSLLYTIYAGIDGEENESILSARMLEGELQDSVREIFRKGYQPVAISTETAMTQKLSQTFEEIEDKIFSYSRIMEETGANYRKLFAQMDEENAVYGRVEILFSMLLVDIANLVEALRKGVYSIDEFLNERASTAQNAKEDERDSMIKKAESSEQAFEELSSLFQFM